MKILIVDDETRICESLQSAVPWSDIGISEVATADSGEAGYRTFLSISPDIVMTDIRMDGMSGLDMIRKIRQHDSMVPILILSAYDLFSYAKDAVHLNVTRYILKPIIYGDIALTVSEVVEELKSRKKLNEFEGKIKLQIKNNLGALRQKFLYDALTLPTRFDEDFTNNLQFYQVDQAFLRGGLVMSLQAFWPRNGKVETEKQWQIYRFAVNNIIQEVLSKWQPSYHMPFSEDRITVIFVGSDENELIQDASQATKEIINQIYTFLEIEVNAGFGRWYPHPSNFSKSYKESIEVLKFSEFEGYKRIDHYNDVHETNFYHWPEYPLEEMQIILEAVNRGEWKEAMESWLILESSLLKKDEAVPFDFVKMLCTGLLSTIIAYRCQQQSPNDLPAKLVEIQNYRKKEDLCACVRKLLEQEAESLKNQKNQSTYTEYIKKYVSEHYNENISFAQLANELHLSRTYLSYLFNRDTGETFANYLIQYRITVAKKLMNSSQHLMVREVAAMVGYSDSAYFSRIFKHVTGFSPSEYQMRT
ncbi:helix-turn-helix domain-containing protein [Paenibacillus piri]|uniref:Helix-turn-helix domain-containing protein n=1 Tax=Paenibacillus piri TaxID=2547395 RepID=A0A4R5K851_9BACL|nr:helix-turn-helix domain-containing protein [Paenibacillus piri]TDF89739.1 helix-turn-helix domain-containing protein [Paenibacillus piri]